MGKSDFSAQLTAGGRDLTGRGARVCYLRVHSVARHWTGRLHHQSVLAPDRKVGLMAFLLMRQILN